MAAYVEPVLLAASDAECAVLKNFNMARYEGKNAGSIAMIGQGAGRWPTASAVLRDLSGIAEGEKGMFPENLANGAADNSAECHAYYVRLPAACAGSLPAAEVLSGENGILRIQSLDYNAALKADGSAGNIGSLAESLKAAGIRSMAVGGINERLFSWSKKDTYHTRREALDLYAGALIIS